MHFITSIVSYYLGYKTGKYVIPPIVKFIEDQHFTKTILPKIRDSLDKHMKKYDENNDQKKLK